MKTPEQKTYVANAIAKHPSKRTAEEKAAILESMTEWENEATMKTTQHTPGPWTIKNQDGNDVLIYGDGNIVPHDGRTSPVAVCYGVDRKANAQFIVTACNANNGLLETLKAAQRFFDVLREHYRDVFEFNSNDADGLLDWDVQMKIQDAIAKAGKE